MGRSNWEGVKYNALEYLYLEVFFVINRILLSRGGRYNFIGVSKNLWDAVFCGMLVVLTCLNEEAEQGTICQENLELHRNPWV